MWVSVDFGLFYIYVYKLLQLKKTPSMLEFCILRILNLGFIFFICDFFSSEKQTFGIEKIVQ